VLAHPYRGQVQRAGPEKDAALSFSCIYCLSSTPVNYRELPAPVGRGLSGRRGRYSKRGVNKLSNAPSPVNHTNGLRRRHAEGFVHAAEIVVSDVQRDGRDVIIQLL
jgi:hypothetical protein